MTLSAAAEIGHLTPIRFGYYLKQKMRSSGHNKHRQAVYR